MSQQSASVPARQPSVRSAGLAFVGSLLPGLVALLPLSLGSAWNLSPNGNVRYASDFDVWFHLVLFAVAVAPFLAGAVSFLSVMAARRDSVAAFWIAAWWSGGLGLLACFAAALSSGGF